MITRKESDVLVVGGGSWGSALATVLAANGKKTLLWVRRKGQAEEINSKHQNSVYLPDLELHPNIEATTDIETAVKGSPIIIVAVPSKHFRSIAAKIGDHIEGDQVLVHAAKGIELKTYKRMSQVLREETCALKIGALSGPNLAVEVMQGHPAGAVIASCYDEVIRKMQALFTGSRLRLYSGHDIIGTEIGGTFKNIIAIAAGAIGGMGLGDNTKSLLMTRGVGEMSRFGVALGADVFTFGGLAGIGDLTATCASTLSRNYRVGKALAEGEKTNDIVKGMKYVAEGVYASQAIYDQAEEVGLDVSYDLPIVKAVYNVVHKNISTNEALKELLTLPTGDELSSLRYL